MTDKQDDDKLFDEVSDMLKEAEKRALMPKFMHKWKFPKFPAKAQSVLGTVATVTIIAAMTLFGFLCALYISISKYVILGLMAYHGWLLSQGTFVLSTAVWHFSFALVAAAISFAVVVFGATALNS